MNNLRFSGESGSKIIDFVDINAIFISNVEKSIESIFSFFSFLLKAEDEVNSVVNSFGHHIRFKGFSVQNNEVVRVASCPIRENHIVDSKPTLLDPEIIMIQVDIHLRQRIELRSELSYIGNFFGRVFERLCNGVKKPRIREM